MFLLFFGFLSFLFLFFIFVGDESCNAVFYCRFGNCLHTREPGCRVIAAVEEGRIALSRYESYLSMLEDKGESKYRE